MDSFFSNNKKVLRLIWGISVAIPLAVTVLVLKPQLLSGIGDWVKVLPHINAVINTTTAVLLMLAVYFIKQGNVQWHKTLMLSAFVLGTAFLILYVIYHSAAVHTVYGDLNHDGALNEEELGLVGNGRKVFLIILMSHIALSVGVLPVVLFAFFYALTGRIEAHKKVVKIAFPVWLYVSISGVVVYLMISPYYF